MDFGNYESDSDNGHGDADALDFSAAEDADEASGVAALDEFAPIEPEEPETELEAIAATTEAGDTEDDEDGAQLFTVTNPPETVSVSALMDGRTQRVTLAPTASKLTESELVDEILVLADLARQKGLAGQHTYLLDSASDNEGLRQLGDLGIDGTQVLHDFMRAGMQLPTPQQAEANQAEVFAARYAPEK
ncbi:hypothetical protein A5647_11305 [Mycobacterium sp. 1100029.7]|nr:hypothetical protein A5647_11305 [Mycobacterium sp. 1100029.7]